MVTPLSYTEPHNILTGLLSTFLDFSALNLASTMWTVRAVMHAGIANWRFPLKSVAGKTFPAFPAHAQPAIVRKMPIVDKHINIWKQRNNSLHVANDICECCIFLKENISILIDIS